MRGHHVEHARFRSPTALPVLATVTCVVLLTQQEAQHWALAGVLLAVGLVVYLLTRWAARAARAREETS